MSRRQGRKAARSSGGDNNGKGYVKSLQDLPVRLGVLARMKVARRNDYVRGGMQLLPVNRFDELYGQTSSDNRFAGVTGMEYTYYTYKRTPCPNRDAFSPIPVKKNVTMKGYWQDRWFTLEMRYDGTRSADNFYAEQDDGETRESVTRTAEPCEQPLRLYIQPWAWWPKSHHRFTIDWIAARNVADEEPSVQFSGDF